MQEEHDKKNPGAGSDDQAKVPVKPAALADSDLDKVAGGISFVVRTNGSLSSKIAPNKFTP
jgi:hypothetical protein